MELEFYQFVNLVNNSVPFALLDITNGHAKIPVESKKYFKAPVALSVFSVNMYVNTDSFDPLMPVIVFHNWLWVAKYIAKRLEQNHNLANVCYLSKRTFQSQDF